MATIYVCDRCHKEMVAFNRLEVHRADAEFKLMRTFDLCPECEDWLMTIFRDVVNADMAVKFWRETRPR